MKDNDGSITSLFFISCKANARCNAAVPLFTATQLFALTNFLKPNSNFATFAIPEPEAQNLQLTRC